MLGEQLASAITGNDVTLCKQLLHRGADTNAKLNRGADIRDGYTPLHLASDKGHLDIARLLIERGANIEATDREVSVCVFEHMCPD